MREFDWNLVKAFVAVADTGSLSAAARDCGASQPTIGRHIDELERQLGVTLFERVPRGMALTDAGAHLLDKARSVQIGASAFAIAASGESQEISGTVRITASQIVSHLVLPPIICRLRELEPQLQVELVSSDTVQNLLTRDADIAIRMVEPAQAELVSRKVNEAAMGVFAAPSYLERRGEPRVALDILEHDIVGFDRNDLIIRSVREMGFPVSRETFRVRTDDQVLYWRLVEEGAGIGFGQLYAGLRSTKVKRILPGLPIQPLPMYVAAHRELRTSLRVRRAYDFICEALGSLQLGED